VEFLLTKGALGFGVNCVEIGNHTVIAKVEAFSLADLVIEIKLPLKLAGRLA